MRDVPRGERVPQTADIPQYPFLKRITPVPVAAGVDPRLNETSFRLLINTSGNSDNNGRCWLTQEQHAALIRRTRNTVNRALSKLARMGYLRAIHNVLDPNTHRRRKTIYVVTDPLDEPAPTGQ